MKNLDSVFAAYVIGWGVFFVFFLTIVKRTSELRSEIERLRVLCRGNNEQPRP
jgi:hypothetical protein